MIGKIQPILNKILKRTATTLHPNLDAEYLDPQIAPILQLIDTNGSPVNLNLSGYDFTNLDLGRQNIQREANHQRSRGNLHPIWVHERTGGINLEGAIFANTQMNGVNLSYAYLKKACFFNAKAQFSDLSRAYLKNTDFRDADLSGSNLLGVIAGNAKFQKADLSTADLTGADFQGAELENTSLYRTILSGTKFSRYELSFKILQEEPGKLVDFLKKHHPEVMQDPGAENFVRTYAQPYNAYMVYSNLKTNFISIGNFSDAGWAHKRERRSARVLHRPKLAGYYFRKETEWKYPFVSPKFWWFYSKHLLIWFSSLLADWSNGYGENPERVGIVSTVIIAIFAILYYWAGGIVETDSPLTWLDYLNYSFGVFTTMGYEDIQAYSPIAQILSSFEALLGISMLALLMFTLGNRISRS